MSISSLLHAVLGLTLALLIAEAGWRAFSYPPLLVVDPVFDFALRPSSRLRWKKVDVDQEVVTNAFGFHDEEYPRAKPPGLKRVLLVGNSFMEALQVDIAATFAKRLQSSLGAHAQVVNASRLDRGCLDYELMLRHGVFDFQPDLVLLAFTMTDPWHDSVNLPQMELDGQGRPVRYRATGINARLPWLKPLLHRSWTIKHLLASSSVLSAKLRSGAPPPPPTGRTIAYTSTVTLDDSTDAGRAMWATTLASLDRIAADCKAHRTPLAILLVPAEDQVDPLPGVAPIPRYGQRIVGTWAARSNVPVLDLAPAFEASHEKPLYFMEGHWRPRGHALAATAASPFVARLLAR